MDKFTHVEEDGTLTDYFPQAYTDAAVAAVTAAPAVAPEDTEVDILLSDGSTKKFVPAA